MAALRSGSEVGIKGEERLLKQQKQLSRRRRRSRSQDAVGNSKPMTLILRTMGMEEGPCM